MITENLSTLKIHKLTKEQYDKVVSSGTIDENALKHGHILGDYSTMATSPLYNIERYKGEPEEEDKVLFEIQNYMKKNNISYYENQDAFYSLVNKKASDITEEMLCKIFGNI